MTEKNCLSCLYEPRWKSRWDDEPGYQGLCGRSYGGAPLILIINEGRKCRQPFDIDQGICNLIHNCPMWERKVPEDPDRG